MADKGNKADRGNSIASAAAFDKEMVRLGLGLIRVDNTLERLFEEDIVVLDIRVRIPEYAGAEFLCICSARIGGEHVVAFSSGTTFIDALRGMLARMENGTVKWSVDKYRK